SSRDWSSDVCSSDLSVLITKFSDVAPDKAAPGEGEIELYANPDKTYIEIEEQGAYVELPPGKSLEWEVIWYLKNLPEKIRVEKEIGRASCRDGAESG